MCANPDQSPQTLPNPLEEKQRLPRRVSPSENAMHQRNRYMIASAPRSILGSWIVRGLAIMFGRPMPNAPVDPARIQAELAVKSAQRIDEIRQEVKAEAEGIVDTSQQNVEQLRESVERGEAQTNFEALMRGKDLRDSLK